MSPHNGRDPYIRQAEAATAGPWQRPFPRGADGHPDGAVDYHGLLTDAASDGLAANNCPALRCAVVGAGLAGLAAARELFRSGVTHIDLYAADAGIGGRDDVLATATATAATATAAAAAAAARAAAVVPGNGDEGHAGVLGYYRALFGIATQAPFGRGTGDPGPYCRWQVVDNLGHILLSPQYIGLRSVAESLLYRPVTSRQVGCLSLYDACWQMPGMNLYTHNPVRRIARQGDTAIIMSAGFPDGKEYDAVIVTSATGEAASAADDWTEAALRRALDAVVQVLHRHGASFPRGFSHAGHAMRSAAGAGQRTGPVWHTILPMNMTATPKFHRPRLLIVGCGDVGMRLLPLLRARFRVFALTSQPARCAVLRALGAVPVVADLDDPASLRRLAGLAQYVVHLAPPPSEGALDRRSRHLCAILPAGGRLVYVSTTGVYGDCGGALIDECRPVAPRNGRAQRRVDAEQVLRRWAVRNGATAAILRVPGIYAADRLPLRRLHQGTPALAEADDVYTNHIHADDLARIVARALLRGRPGRVYHAVDDSDMKMAQYFDAVADAFALPRPPRLARAELERAVTPTLLSFMSESRRLRNARLKAELGVRLRYPTVAHALAACQTAKIPV